MAKNNLLFLRRLHGRLYEWRIAKQNQFHYWKNLTFPLGTKVYVIGTPEHSNIGDSAIVLAELAFLEKCGFKKSQIKEITRNEYILYSKLIKKSISTKHLLCWHGGGNMGNQWINEEYFRRNAMHDFKENPMIIFPQTIFYTDTEFGELEKKKSIDSYNGNQKLTIVAREKKSFDFMHQLYPNTEIILTPDIVLSSNLGMYGIEIEKKTDVLLCLRNDAERQLSDADGVKLQKILEKYVGNIKKTDMHLNIAVTKKNRRECVRMKMKEFMSAKLVVTDRLHGMVFAAITGTPCIVFSNYNQKVSGTYEWIKTLPYIKYVQSIGEMEKVLDELLEIDEAVYDNSNWIDKFYLLEKSVKRYV